MSIEVVIKRVKKYICMFSPWPSTCAYLSFLQQNSQFLLPTSEVLKFACEPCYYHWMCRIKSMLLRCAPMAQCLWQASWKSVNWLKSWNGSHTNKYKHTESSSYGRKWPIISHWYMSLQIPLYVLYECINYEETHVISSMTYFTWKMTCTSRGNNF